MSKITQYCTLHHGDKAWIDKATSSCPWCEIEQLKKSSCHVFRVTNGDVLGTCYAFYDFFDVYWDDGTSNLALTELSVYGIRKTCQDT